MKTIKLLAAFAALFLVACGGPQHAERDQIKAWVLMENINSDYSESLADNFMAEVVAEESIELLNSEHPTAKVVIQDGINPYVGLCLMEARHVLKPYHWELNRNKLIKYIKECGDLVEIAKWSEMDGECVDYFKSHKDEGKQLLGQLASKWVDYIYAYAAEEVKVKEWNTCLSQTTDTISAYYVTYEIGTGYYVLIRLIEVDGGDEFEVKRIYRGDSLIDLEQAWLDADL